MKGVTTLVLAGSRGPGDPLAEAAGVTHKALIPIHGVPMLGRVLNALLAARVDGHVGRIAISIERPDILQALAKAGADFTTVPNIEILPAAASPAASTANAIAHLGTPLFMTTADHALLRHEWITHFLHHVPHNSDVAAAIASEEIVRKAAPMTRRTFLRFSDGAYSGCNMFYLRTPEAKGLVDFWREMEAHRKNPLQLLRRLGVTFAARYAMGALSRAQALARLQQITRARGALIEMPFGEASIDVDKPQDLQLVEQLLMKEKA